jgi:lipopolysaccharide export system permease protein
MNDERMNATAHYLARQTLGPLIFFTLVFTGVIWLTQALKLLDIIFEQNQAAVTFFRLSFLSLPTILALSLPVAVLASMLYTLNRLHMDRELTVMLSAGISEWGIARPLFFLAALVALMVLILNLLLAPAGTRQIKDDIQTLRSDVTLNLVREGMFSTPMEGLTVYVRQRNPGGSVEKLLVHDERNPDMQITYMAQSGALVNTVDGPRLIMVNGNIQQAKRNGRGLTMLHFDRYNFDLSPFTQKMRPTREPSERYLHELFSPDPKDEWSEKMATTLRAEGHARLSAPLYPLAYCLIAVAAILGGRFSRRGYGWRILTAVLAALVLRLAAYGIQSRAEIIPALNVLMYLLPAGAILMAIAIIDRWRYPLNFARPLALAGKFLAKR